MVGAVGEVAFAQEVSYAYAVWFESGYGSVVVLSAEDSVCFALVGGVRGVVPMYFAVFFGGSPWLRGGAGRGADIDAYREGLAVLDLDQVGNELSPRL